MKLGWLAALAAGCVIHVPEDAEIGWDDGSDEVSLRMEDGDYLSEGRSLVTLVDDHGEADFRDVIHVESLSESGEVEIVEWSGSKDRLDLVIDVREGTTGEQLLSVDFIDGTTAFASFEVE